jgi:hypothetical protein
MHHHRNSALDLLDLSRKLMQRIADRLCRVNVAFIDL